MGNDREVLGTVVGIDGDSVARVLIGEDQEEWFFPLNMLPDRVCEGDTLRFAEQAGRYAVIGKIRLAQAAPSIEDRLSRPLNTMRTAELDAAELQLAKAQAAADPASHADAGPPRPPTRIRASRQRRW